MGQPHPLLAGEAQRVAGVALPDQLRRAVPTEAQVPGPPHGAGGTPGERIAQREAARHHIRSQHRAADQVSSARWASRASGGSRGQARRVSQPSSSSEHDEQHRTEQRRREEPADEQRETSTNGIQRGRVASQASGTALRRSTARRSGGVTGARPLRYGFGGGSGAGPVRSSQAGGPGAAAGGAGCWWCRASRSRRRTAADFAARARTALAALADRPGFRRGRVGRSVDDPAEWVLVTEWDGVGAYRRALSAYQVKVDATPLLAQARDEPGAYEVPVAVDGPGAELTAAASDGPRTPPAPARSGAAGAPVTSPPPGQPARRRAGRRPGPTGQPADRPTRADPASPARRGRTGGRAPYGGAGAGGLAVAAAAARCPRRRPARPRRRPATLGVPAATRLPPGYAPPPPPPAYAPPPPVPAAARPPARPAPRGQAPPPGARPRRRPRRPRGRAGRRRSVFVVFRGNPRDTADEFMAALQAKDVDKAHGLLCKDGQRQESRDELRRGFDLEIAHHHLVPVGHRAGPASARARTRPSSR